MLRQKVLVVTVTPPGLCPNIPPTAPVNTPTGGKPPHAPTPLSMPALQMQHRRCTAGRTHQSPANLTPACIFAMEHPRQGDSCRKRNARATTAAAATAPAACKCSYNSGRCSTRGACMCTETGAGAGTLTRSHDRTPARAGARGAWSAGIGACLTARLGPLVRVDSIAPASPRHPSPAPSTPQSCRGRPCRF